LSGFGTGVGGPAVLAVNAAVVLAVETKTVLDVGTVVELPESGGG